MECGVDTINAVKRHYVGKKKKSGRPLTASERGRLGGLAKAGKLTCRGTPLTPKGEKQIAERIRREESKLEATPSTFVETSQGVVCGRCMTLLQLLYILAAQEAVFWCQKCTERIYVPNVAL